MQPKVTQPRMKATERQARALEMRKAGYTYPEIAAAVGYAGKASAYRAVDAALKKTLQEPADELRVMEAERLDAMLLGLWEKATTGDTWSVDRVLGIMERRARLLGLDRPPEHDWTAATGSFLAGVQAGAAQAEDMSEHAVEP